MLSCARAAPFVATLALLAAVLVLVPAASANGGPRLKAYDYALAFVGEDEEGDYIWRYGYTMCTSHAARVKERFLIGAEGAVLFTVDYLDKRKAGCKRYRSYFDQNVREVRARVRLWWRGLRVIAPWREATCEPRCP
jgi:hypothetical protein